MKKFWKYMAACGVAAAILPLASCDDTDDYSSSPNMPNYNANFVYMLDPSDAYSTFEYKASGDFLSTLENPLVLTQVRCTKPAPSDVTVNLEIDPSLVDEYNAANSTDCIFMQGVDLVKKTFTIPKGEYLATDKVAIEFKDLSGLVKNDKNLVLPVVISQTTGDLTISKHSRFFIVFNYMANELRPVLENNVKVDVSLSNWQTAYTNTTFTNFISAKWAADYPVTISGEVDRALIEAYNGANGTSYKPLDATIQPITLAQGATSANMQIRLADYTGVDSDEEYLVPIRLSITSGEGAALSDDIVYVIVRKMPVELSYVSSRKPDSWVAIPYNSTWSLTKKAEDGSVEDFTFLVASPNGGDYVEVGDQFIADLGTETTVGGIGFSYYAWYYAIEIINDIAVSSDGQTWKPVLGCVFGGDQTAYAAFNKPQTCRYIRFTNQQYRYAPYGAFMTYLSFWSVP